MLQLGGRFNPGEGVPDPGDDIDEVVVARRARRGSRALSHGVSPIADSFPRNSSGVSPKTSVILGLT